MIYTCLIVGNVLMVCEGEKKYSENHIYTDVGHQKDLINK